MIDKTEILLERIAKALEKLAAPNNVDIPPPSTDANAFIWQQNRFMPVNNVNRLPSKLLQGIDQQKNTLMDNSWRFAKGFAANNALLWGARGTGKSSLVKAVHGEIAKTSPLVLIEISREDLASLPMLLHILAADKRRFIVFCDDLAFESGESSYKSLKAILEGGIEGRPDNVIFYATSNRRHLMAREMIENEQIAAIHSAEAVHEKVSLSDRFGLWLGFYSADQEIYLTMINAYADALGLAAGSQRTALEKASLEWAITRGDRSGRVAWQFIMDAAGKAKIPLDSPTLK